MYKIILTKAVEKQLKKIPKKDQLKITDKLQSLSSNSKPSEVKPLKGKLAPYYRIRSGDYRVIYAIEDDKLVVLIIKIAHRKDVYDSEK